MPTASPRRLRLAASLAGLPGPGIMRTRIAGGYGDHACDRRAAISPSELARLVSSRPLRRIGTAELPQGSTDGSAVPRAPDAGPAGLPAIRWTLGTRRSFAGRPR
jgi:hypothetical protein